MQKGILALQVVHVLHTMQQSRLQCIDHHLQDPLEQDALHLQMTRIIMNNCS